MSISLTRNREEILGARARIAPNVVHRMFAAETVVLNLDTGKYHGLNPTGGHMLEVLNKADSVAAAAELLSAEYGRPLEQLQEDVCRFCVELRERGLVELHSNAG